MRQQRQHGHLEDRLDDIVRRIRALKRRLDRTMATVAELNSAVAAVSAAVAQNGTDIKAAIDDIAALQAGGAGGGGIAPADLDPVVASLTAMAESMTAANAALEAVLPQAPPPSQQRR